MNTKEKHDTASVYIFYKEETEYKLLLVHHKKFNRWMVPGGHVEGYENHYECALREVKEESGLDVHIIPVGSKYLGYSFLDAKSYQLPFVIQEEYIPAHKGKPEHIHLDFLYVAVSKSNAVSFAESESNEIKWYSKNELKGLDMFESTKHIALLLFKKIKLINLLKHYA